MVNDILTAKGALEPLHEMPFMELYCKHNIQQKWQYNCIAHKSENEEVFEIPWHG